MDDRDPKLCDRFEEALPALLGIDGERLPPGEEEALLRHEASCPRCQELRRSYAATVDLLRALPRKEAPADFLTWVQKDSARPSRLPGRGPRRLWLAAAAFLALGVTGFLVVRGLWMRAERELALREVASIDAKPAPAPPMPEVEESPLQAMPSKKVPEEVAVASPVEDGEAIGIVFNVQVPLPEDRWAEDVRKLEADLRTRFEAPLAKLEVTPPAGATVALRNADEERPGARARRDAAVADDATPAERDLRLDVDARQVEELVERIEEWTRAARGSVLVDRRQPEVRRGAPAAAAAEAPATRLRVQLKLRPVGAAKSP